MLQKDNFLRHAGMTRKMTLYMEFYWIKTHKAQCSLNVQHDIFEMIAL